jgi:hypothetical protein
MGDLLAKLIPLGLAGALSPVAIVGCIALLSSRRPVANALAYLAGITTVLGAAGAVVLALFGPGSVTDAESSHFVNAAELGIGLLLLVLAFTQAVGKPVRDAPPPSWIGRLAALSPAHAYGFGVLVEATNVKRLAIYLAGLSQISAADVTGAQGAFALVVFVGLLETGMMAPVVIYLALPGRSETILAQLRNWLLTYNRRILAVLFAVIGVLLVERGLSGLT